MRFVFLDAVIGGAPHEFMQQHGRVPWWSYHQYKTVLLSYRYWMPGRSPWITTALDAFREDPDMFVFGDSGGFSILMENIALDPVLSYRWMEEFCDVGVILDVPPFRPKEVLTARGFGYETWSSSLKQTCTNTRIALAHYYDYLDRGGEDFRWWGVVHGLKFTEMDEWYRRVADIYPFVEEGEGWAFKPPKIRGVGAHASIARCMHFARMNEIRNVHLLQATARRKVITALALGVMGAFNTVTVDSSVATLTSITRGFFTLVRDGWDLDITREVSRNGERFAYDAMQECPCLGCALSREDKAQPGEEISHYLMLHNHTKMQEYFDGLLQKVDKWGPKEFLRQGLGPVEAREVLQEWEGIETGRVPRRAVSILDRI